MTQPKESRPKLYGSFVGLESQTDLIFRLKIHFQCRSFISEKRNNLKTTSPMILVHWRTQRESGSNGKFPQHHISSVLLFKNITFSLSTTYSHCPTNPIQGFAAFSLYSFQFHFIIFVSIRWLLLCLSLEEGLVLETKVHAFVRAKSREWFRTTWNGTISFKLSFFIVFFKCFYL